MERTAFGWLRIGSTGGLLWKRLLTFGFHEEISFFFFDKPMSLSFPNNSLHHVVSPGREADHSPPCSAEVKEWVELYLHSLNTPSWRGA
jgi:hypothetical protein